MIARLGAHLLTGAGYGVMAAVAEGFVSAANRLGWSIGIVPRQPDGPFDRPNRDPDGRLYPNPFVEIVIRTPLPPHVGDWRTTPTRNHINVLTADAIIALPGGIGTTNELNMAAEYRNERDRPPAERRTILVGPQSEFAPSHRENFIHVATLDEAERQVRRVLAAHGFSLDARCAP
jgi:predicted Rossmann-fold nucleotide-binding protein